MSRPHVHVRSLSSAARSPARVLFLSPIVGLAIAGSTGAQDTGGLRLRERLVLDGHAIEFGKIGAVTADKAGTIYVADIHESAQEVMVFTESGRRAGTIGRSGDGPGEFRALTPNLAWRSDTLITVDGWSGRRRITLFLGQRVIRTEPLPSVPAGHVESDVRLFATGTAVHLLQLFHRFGAFDLATSEFFAPASAVYYRLDFTRQATPLSALRDSASTGARPEMVPCWSPDKRAWAGVPTPFTDRGPLRAFLPTGELVVADRDSFRIDIVDTGSGRVARSIRRTVAPVRLSDAVWESLPSTRELRRRERAWRGELRATGTRDAPCAVYRMRTPFQPVLRTILADEAGKLWVEVTSSNGHELGLVDEQGRWIGSAPMPPRDTRVTPFVRANRLYVVTVDELDVQSVKVYDIQVGATR